MLLGQRENASCQSHGGEGGGGAVPMCLCQGGALRGRERWGHWPEGTMGWMQEARKEACLGEGEGKGGGETRREKRVTGGMWLLAYFSCNSKLLLVGKI